MKNKHIIFLDTSIFESENFFKGRNINHICELSKEGLIEVKITDLTYNEIVNRIRENIIKSISSIKKANSLLNSEAKILKNIDEFYTLFNFPKTEIDDLVSRFQIKLDNFILDNSIEIVDSIISNTKEVFRNYFDSNPPFKDGKKKNEFPDAFTYSTIKEWCKLNSLKVYFVTNDSDFDNLSTEIINCSMNLSSIIDLTTREINEEHTKYIDTIYYKYTQNIYDALTENFNTNLIDAVYDQISNDPFYDEPEIDFPIDITVEFKHISINELNLNYDFSYEIDCEIFFLIPVEYIDYSPAFYDKEDGTWFGEERIIETKSYIATISAKADFQYNLNDDYDYFDEISDFQIRNLEQI